jgi:multisubunit Na+/H+ antiporter MnhE subunit
MGIDCRWPEVDETYDGWSVVERSRLSVYFLYLAWRLWKSVVTLAVTGNTISGRLFWRQRVPEFQGIDCRWPEVDGTYDGWSVVERSRLSVYFLYLAWRLWKSVVTLAVKGNTISGRFFLFQRVPEFEGHRLPLTGSRWTYDGWSVVERSRLSVYLLYLAWRLWKSVVTLVFTVNTISGRLFYQASAAGVSVASTVRWPQVDGTYGGWSVVERSRLSVYFLYLAWRLWKSVVTLAVKGILFPVGFFAVRGCRSLRGIDCRWPEVDGTYDGWSVVERSRLSVYFLY